MARIHLALMVDDVERSVADYSQRLGAGPVVVVASRYALWRTTEVNLSVTVGSSAEQQAREIESVYGQLGSDHP